MTDKINAYEMLNIEEGATLTEIRSSYHQKAKLYHPDCGGMVEDFLNLKKARDILLKGDRRELMGILKIFDRPRLRLKPSEMHSGIERLMKGYDERGRVRFMKAVSSGQLLQSQG